MLILREMSTCPLIFFLFPKKNFPPPFPPPPLFFLRLDTQTDVDVARNGDLPHHFHNTLTLKFLPVCRGDQIVQPTSSRALDKCDTRELRCVKWMCVCTCVKWMCVCTWTPSRLPTQGCCWKKDSKSRGPFAIIRRFLPGWMCVCTWTLSLGRWVMSHTWMWHIPDVSAWCRRCRFHQRERMH